MIPVTLLPACHVPNLDTPKLAFKLPPRQCLGTASLNESQTLCTYNLVMYDMWATLPNYTAAPKTWLSGESYWLDTAIQTWHQFKHSTGKFIQLALLQERFDHVIMNRVNHLPGGGVRASSEGHTQGVYNCTVAPLVQSWGARVHLGGKDKPPVCAHNVLFVSHRCPRAAAARIGVFRRTYMGSLINLCLFATDTHNQCVELADSQLRADALLTIPGRHMAAHPETPTFPCPRW